MQDRFDEEFDLIVRSMAQDAREEAPRRVWSSVRRSLRGRAVASAWAWRALAGAAVAAVVALVAIPSLKRGSMPSTPETSVTLAQAAQVPEASEVAPAQEIEISELTLASEPVPLVAQAYPSVESRVVIPAEPEETAPESVETAPVAAPAPAQAALPAAADPAVETAPAAQAHKSTPSGVDVFALMEAEDAARMVARRPALTLGTQMGTNDKATAGFSPVRLAAPSKTSPLSKAVSEAGESTFDIPISFGLGVKAYFTDRWAVGTGIIYTRLGRRFEGVYTETNTSGVTTNVIKGRFTNVQQYIGIPLTLSYDIVSNDAVSVYGFGGAAVERAISHRFRIPGASAVKGDISGVQFSASAGFGIGFKLTDHLGLYVDPSLVYYFDCNQPKSIRTQQQWQGRLEAGFRLDL